MKAKKVLTIVLVIFVAVAVGFLIANAFAEKATTPKSANASASAGPSNAATTANADKICNPNDDPSCISAAKTAPDTEQDVKPNAGGPSRKVIAYYFHGNFRCSTCRAIEALSQESIQTGFAEALKQGILEWKVVNVEEPANRHFIKDYQLYSKSLVLVKMEGDKQLEWKNLDRIWELVRDKPAFLKYVQAEISGYLKK